MIDTQEAEAEARKCARVIGPFLMIITATEVARASDMRALLAPGVAA